MNLHYPFKRFLITQKWGNKPLNPDGTPVYAKFGFALHNGVDAVAVEQAKLPSVWPIYCPMEGMVVQSIEYHPEGSGNMIRLITKDKIPMFEQTCNAMLVFMHCKKVLVPVGYEPALGELIAIADNTGFSTGPHTHMGLYRVQYDGHTITEIDVNEAEGSFDPSLFFTGEFAVDKADVGTLVKSGLRYLNYLLT